MHIPILIIKALLTSLLALKDIFKNTSLSVEWVISLEKSSFFKFGREANPSSMNDCFPSASIPPPEVMFLQKFRLRTFS
jgi:hypothetical protein